MVASVINPVLNLPFYVLAMVGVPVNAWGGTGVAKSAGNESCAKNIGYNFHQFIPAHHLPEELSGTPVVFRDELLVKMLPLDWVHTLTLPFAWLMLDEINTSTSMMRALCLSVLNEKRIGTIRFDPTVIITSACNPPEMAPNAAPLEGSVMNRMAHWKWQTPVADFLEGIETGVFPSPKIPTVKNHELAFPKWGRRIRMFLESKPEFIQTDVPPEGEFSFPSLRTWMYVKKGCSGLDSVNAPAKDYTDLVSACIGKSAAAMFVSSPLISTCIRPVRSWRARSRSI
jgi:hypothetical protein